MRIPPGRLLSFLLPLLAFAPATQAEQIVVYGLKAQAGVSQKEANALNPVLEAELYEISGYDFLSETDIMALVRAEEDRQLLGCGGEKCTSQLAAAFGAEMFLSSAISKQSVHGAKSTYHIACSLLRAEDGKAIARGNATFSLQNPSSQTKALRKAVSKLFADDKLRRKRERPLPMSPRAFDAYLLGYHRRLGVHGESLYPKRRDILNDIVFTQTKHDADKKISSLSSAVRKWRSLGTWALFTSPTKHHGYDNPPLEGKRMGAETLLRIVDELELDMKRLKELRASGTKESLQIHDVQKWAPPDTSKIDAARSYSAKTAKGPWHLHEALKRQKPRGFAEMFHPSFRGQSFSIYAKLRSLQKEKGLGDIHEVQPENFTPTMWRLTQLHGPSIFMTGRFSDDGVYLARLQAKKGSGTFHKIVSWDVVDLSLNQKEKSKK